MQHLSRRSLLMAGCAAISGCSGGASPTPTPTPTPPPTSPTPPTPPPTPPTPPPPPPPPTTVRLDFSFAAGADGFSADFTDYAPGQEVGENGIRFASGVQQLPAPLADRTGFFLGGTNRSDDLFMVITRPVSGLVPGQRYRVRVDVTLATNVPPNCVGVGGSPGEGVAVKAGATAVQPAKFVQNSRVVSTIDKANQFASGREAIVVGTFAGGDGGCGDSQGLYRLKTLSTASPEPLPITPPPADALLVTADSGGRLWIVIGTESSFEARTEIYYLGGSATFTPV